MTLKRQPTVRQNSRAGCAKCKERRIKCDQGSPFCRNCTARQLKCPGYETKYRWKGKHQISQHDTASGLGEGSSGPFTNARTPDASIHSSNRKPTSESSVISSLSRGTFAHPAAWLLTPSSIAYPDGFALPSPTLALPMIPLDDNSRRLISHYFRFVWKINSCSDYPVDSLRIVTQGLMSSSQLVYFCILSMSAAHLNLVQPTMSDESLVYLTKAITLLRLQLNGILDKAATRTQREQGLDQALMGIILIGISTSWHKSSGLGLEHIVGSRILLQEYICPKLYDGSLPDRRKLGFFIGLQAYWETVAAFVLDQNLEQLDYLQDSCVELSMDTIYIHPWTGISSTIWAMLAKAGCVARKRFHLLEGMKEADQAEFAAQMNQLMQQARIIEAQLLNYELPSTSRIDSTFAGHASIVDLERIAECCRLAALLELYRAFGSAWDTQFGVEMLATKLQIVEWESESAEQPDSSPVVDIYSFLTLRILSILRCISSESSTQCLQPILLLIAGSNLFDNAAVVSPHKATLDYESTDFSWTPPDTIQAWRQFVYQRIARVEQLAKLESLRRMRMILTEVWACADAIGSAEQDTQRNGEVSYVHWITIMEEKGLRFLF